jgi:hypothetical protein
MCTYLFALLGHADIVQTEGGMDTDSRHIQCEDCVDLCLLQSKRFLKRGEAKMSSIQAVVANFHKNEDTGWLTQAGIPFEDVGTCVEDEDRDDPLCGERAIGEARPWLQWIVKHHGQIFSEYVAFLHGHQTSWHTQRGIPVVDRIRQAKPETVTMLSDAICTWKKDDLARVTKSQEAPGLNTLANAFFWDEFRGFVEGETHGK